MKVLEILIAAFYVLGVIFGVGWRTAFIYAVNGNFPAKPQGLTKKEKFKIFLVAALWPFRLYCECIYYMYHDIKDQKFSISTFLSLFYFMLLSGAFIVVLEGIVREIK